MDELTDTFHGLGVNTINQEALEKIVHMMKASKLDAISASDLADMLKTTSISENNSNAGTATKVGETSLPPPPFTIPPTPVMNETPALSTNKANLGDFVEGASNFNFTMGSSASKKGNGRKQHKSNSSPSVLSKSNMNSNSTLPVPPSAFPFNVAKTDSSDLSPTTSASTFSSNPDVGVFWGTGMNIHTDANAVSYDEKENVNVQSDTHSTAGTGFESFVFGNELPIPPVTSSKAAPKETKAQAAGNVDTKDMPNISFTIPDTGTIAEAMEKANAAKHAAKVALDTAMPHHDPFDRDSDDDSDEDAIWEDEDDSDSQGDRMHNESASDYETTASEEEGENRDKEEKPFREAAWFEGEDSDPESEAAETENEAASGATGGDTASTVDHTYESEGYTTAPWGETEPVSTGNAPVSGVGYDPGSPMDCESNTQSPWGTAIPSTFTSNIDSAPTPVSFTFGAADINSSNTSTANTAAPPPAPLENPFAFKPPIVSSTTENLFSAENVGFSLGSTGSSTGKKKPHKAASPNVPAKPKDPIFGSSTLPTDIKFDILGNVLPTPPPKSPEKSNMYFNKRTNQYYEISDDSDDEKGGQSNNKSSKSTVSAESVMKSMSDMNVNDATGAGSYPSVRQPSSIPPPPPPKAAKNVIPPPPPHPSAAVKNGPAPTPTPDSASSKLNPSMTLVADTHRKHGKEYYEKEDYLKALDSFTKALQVSPSDWFYRATVLGNRAATFMMVDRYKECADDCQQAIEIDPTLIRLNSRKGRALCKLGHLEAAAESFTKVLEIVAKSANENAATKMGSAYASTSARISAAAAVASSTKENESNKEDAKVGLKQLSQARELVAYITNFDVKDGWADALSGAKASTFQSSNIMQKIDLLLDLCPQMRIAQAYKAKAYVKAGAFDDAKEFIESTVCHTHETILKLQNPEGVPCSGGIEAPFSCPSIKDLDWSINSNATKGEAIQAKLSFIARFILVIGTDSANGQLSLWYLNALKNLEFSRNYSTEMIKKVCCVLETITTQTDHKSGGFNQTKSSSSKAQWLSDELDKVTQISVLKTEADNLFKAGSFAEAIRIYSDMLKVDATAVRWNAVAHGNRAAAYMSLNCYPEAINDCNKAIQLDIDYNKIYLRRARAHKASHHYAACMRDYRRYLASDPVPLDGVAIQKEMEASARDRDAYLNQKNKEASAGSRGATMADKARPNYWDYYSRANEEGDDLPKNKAGVYGKTKNSKPSSDESSNDSGVWSGSSDDEDESYFNRYHGTTNKSKNLSRESYNNFKKQTRDNEFNSAYSRDNEFNSAYSQSKNSAYPPPPPESFRPKPTGNGAANTMPPPPPPASKKTSSSTATDAKKSEEPVKDRDYFYNYYFNGKPPNKAGNKNSTKAAPTATKPEPAQSTKTENPYAKYNNDYYRGKNAYKSPYEGTYNSTNSTANSKYYNYKAGDKSSSGDTSKNSSGNNYNYKNPYDSYYKETRNTSSSNSTNSKSSNHFSGSSSSSKSTSSNKRVTEKTDYYELLGVNSRTATERDIKTAYRKLALKYHPDKNKDAGAVEMFQYLTNAYTVLSDKTSRRKYDISKPF